LALTGTGNQIDYRYDFEIPRHIFEFLDPLDPRSLFQGDLGLMRRLVVALALASYDDERWYSHSAASDIHGSVFSPPELRTLPEVYRQSATQHNTT
jgi:hypothetical protein